MALMVLGKVQRCGENPQRSVESHKQAPDVLPPGADPLSLSKIICLDMCLDHALLGNRDHAYQYAKESISPDAGVCFFMAGLIPWQHKVEALLRGGDLHSARKVVQDLEAYLPAYTRLRIPYHRSLALLAQSEGDPERSEDCMQKAEDLSIKIGLHRGQGRLASKNAAAPSSSQ
jgi:hypothetical protein